MEVLPASILERSPEHICHLTHFVRVQKNLRESVSFTGGSIDYSVKHTYTVTKPTQFPNVLKLLSDKDTKSCRYDNFLLFFRKGGILYNVYRNIIRAYKLFRARLNGMI